MSADSVKARAKAGGAAIGAVNGVERDDVIARWTLYRPFTLHTLQLIYVSNRGSFTVQGR
jgi:hypothetical protein